jgi:hypothetical protein
MPTDEIPPLQNDNKSRIAEKINLTQEIPSDGFNNLMKDVCTDYLRTMNKIIFDQNIRDPTQKEQYSFLTLPEPATPKPVP